MIPILCDDDDDEKIIILRCDFVMNNALLNDFDEKIPHLEKCPKNLIDKRLLTIARSDYDLC